MDIPLLFIRLSKVVAVTALIASACMLCRAQSARSETATISIEQLEKMIGRYETKTDLAAKSQDEQYDKILIYAEEHGLKTDALVDQLDKIRNKNLIASR